MLTSRSSRQQKVKAVSSAKKPLNSNNKKKNVNKRMAKKSPINDNAQYEAALIDPFHATAVGARVPDLYAYPTATYHAEGTIILKSDNNGVASILVNPHPYVSTIDVNGSSIQSTGQQIYGFNPAFAAATTQANMQAVLSSYRMVGAGYELRNLLPPTTCVGRAYIAHVPVSGLAPGPNTCGTIALSANLCSQQITGIVATPSVGYSSDILMLPNATEYTLQDIITNTICGHFKPLSAAAFDFHNTVGSSGLSGTVFAASGAAYSSATGLLVQVDNIQSESSIGWDCALFRFEGLPVNTTFAELKYCYHYEGTPFCPTGAGALVPGTDSRVSTDIALFNKSITKSALASSFVLASKIIGAGIQGYASGGPLSAVASMAAKLGLDL